VSTKTLFFATEDERVDFTLQQIVEQFNYEFPDRITGFYLVGSYARRDAIATSDIDLVIVFKQQMLAVEKKQAATIKATLASKTPCSLDLHYASEQTLLTQGAVRFQQHSELIWGVDLREHVPIKPIANHIRDMMHQTYQCLRNVRGNPETLRMPLQPPDSNDPYLGYTRRFVLGTSAESYASTKDLVTNAMMIANTLLFTHTQQYVGDGSKRGTVAAYRRYINNYWSDFLDTINTQCREHWHYQIPSSDHDQSLLQQLVQQEVEFENAFAHIYTEYLVQEAQADDQRAKLFAIQRLGQLLSLQPHIQDILEALTSEDAAIQHAIENTLQHYHRSC